MIQGYQNLHSHTDYCDGKLSAEDMVKAAIEKGGGSIGFSEHSYVSFERELYSMAPVDTLKYAREIMMLKDKYAGQIDIFLGMEQDYFTDADTIPEGLDYIIGAVHHIELDGAYITIDNSFEGLIQICDKYFGGDCYAMVEHYYATVADIAVVTNADIIGHFDIIAKQNAGGRLFDEANPRYVKASVDAMEKIMDNCRLFEINTGAMYRKGNTVPYPAGFLLRELKKRGGEIIITSDSHDADSLYYRFDEMRRLAKSCGFSYVKRLTRTGWVDEDIDGSGKTHLDSDGTDMLRTRRSG